MLLLLAGALGTLDAAGPCDSPPPLGNGADQSQFCAAMLVQQGRLTVVYDQSHFYPAPDSGYKPADEPRFRQTFVSTINALLQKAPKLYTFGLQKTETAMDHNHTLPPEAIALVKDLTKPTWAEARTVLQDWSRCPEKPTPCTNRNNAVATVEAAVKSIGGDTLKTTSPLSNPLTVGALGVARFKVDDRVGDATKPGAVTILFDDGNGPSLPNGRILSSAQVLNWLNRSFRDKFWISTQIASELQDVYTGLGMLPKVFPSKSGEPKRSIAICESRTVGRILLPAQMNDAAQDEDVLHKILYNLLSQQDFNRNWMSVIESPGGPARVLDLAKLRGAAGRLEYLDMFGLADQQAALQSVGYGVVTQDGPSAGSSNCSPLDLAVTAIPKGDAAATPQTPGTPAAPPATPPAPTADADTGPSVDGAAPAKPKTASPTPPQSASPLAKQKSTRLSTVQGLHALESQDIAPKKLADATNPAPPSLPFKLPTLTLGGGIEYRPGQGIRPIVSFTLPSFQSLLGVSTVSATGGADGTKPLGSGNFQTDYFLFKTLGYHRMSIAFNGGTDSTSKRLLFGQSTDQRKTGGTGRVEFEAVHDWHHVFFQLFGEGASNKVTLSRAGADLTSLHLNTIDAGATIDVYRPARLFATFLEIAPAVHSGIGLAQGVPTFTVGSLDVLLHQRLSDFQVISLDVAGHFKQASSNTPIFEMPSVGGSETLRGFRQDDILGRRFWSVQSELWIPVPFTLAAQSGVGRFLRENIRLAGFGDVGGVYQTRQPIPAYYGPGSTNALDPSGRRSGAGAGIRYIRGNAAIKLDWGHGFGQGQSGPGKNRFYMGVATTRSF
jgi:Omp85 superfamily domain